jgi:hypothetical protein
MKLCLGYQVNAVYIITVFIVVRSKCCVYIFVLWLLLCVIIIHKNENACSSFNIFSLLNRVVHPHLGQIGGMLIFLKEFQQEISKSGIFSLG